MERNVDIILLTVKVTSTSRRVAESMTVSGGDDVAPCIRSKKVSSDAVLAVDKEMSFFLLFIVLS